MQQSRLVPNLCNKDYEINYFVKTKAIGERLRAPKKKKRENNLALLIKNASTVIHLETSAF